LARKLNPDNTIIHLLDIWNFLEYKRIRNSSLVNKLRLKGLRNCKNIITISEFTKQEAVEKLGIDENRITVIRCGVNRNKFYPIDLGFHKKEFKILHVGTEGGRKDFITLLYAFQEIRQHIKNAILIRVGEPEYIDLIKESKLEKYIVYFSKINDFHLNTLYNSADVFVFPSTYEGYGLPVMEALSCGTPVMCSDIPVFREIYKNNVTYFPVGNYHSLSNKILNREYVSFSIQNRFELAEENKWEKFANQYLEYINKRFN